MQPIFPEKLKRGDKIMIVAPSDSLGNISPEVERIAQQRFAEMGFEVSIARHVRELDEFDSSGIASRVADLHEAFSDTTVKGIIAAFGGFNSNQLLRYIDWDIIKNNPKVFIGYSDITALQNAIYTKTGLVTYSGPLYSTFGQKLYFDYTLEYFKKCVCDDKGFDVAPSESWSNDGWLVDQAKRQLLENEGWWVINEGVAEGTIIGGNICTFNLLQGTEYLPDISDSILFIEDDRESKLVHFTRDLQSLIHLPHFDKVKGIVIGRFESPSAVTRDHLIQTIKTKKELAHIPILANVDFGHTEPMITFPIGGKAQLTVSHAKSSLKIGKNY
jgi:muramoyltetrapeptide carboxypeptidase